MRSAPGLSSKSPVRRAPATASAGTQTPVSSLLQHSRAPAGVSAKIAGPSPKSSAAALALSALCNQEPATQTATQTGSATVQPNAEATATRQAVDMPSSRPLPLQYHWQGVQGPSVSSSTPTTLGTHDGPPAGTSQPRSTTSRHSIPPRQTVTGHNKKPKLSSNATTATQGPECPESMLSSYDASVSEGRLSYGPPPAGGYYAPYTPATAAPPIPSSHIEPQNDGGLGRMQMFLDATNHFVAHNPMSPPAFRPPASARGGRKKKANGTASSLGKKAKRPLKTAVAATAANNTSTVLLVTPTPAKYRVNYSRKKKSLGLLCKLFMDYYSKGNNTSMAALTEGSGVAGPVGSETTSHPTVSAEGTNAKSAVSTKPSIFDSEDDERGTVVIDDAAEALGVERRRIYDIVNILESLDILRKKAKNTYDWIGAGHLKEFFATLQSQTDADVDRERKGLGRLSQNFLRLFLHGRTTLGLTEASAELGLTQADDFQDGVAMPGIKTKIRRLYDIANVFVSVGIITKLESDTRKGSRPTFCWAFPTSPQELKAIAAVEAAEGSALLSRVSPTPNGVPSAINREGAAEKPPTAPTMTSSLSPPSPLATKVLNHPNAGLTPATANTKRMLSQINQHGAGTALTTFQVDGCPVSGLVTEAYLPSTTDNEETNLTRAISISPTTTGVHEAR